MLSNEFILSIQKLYGDVKIYGPFVNYQNRAFCIIYSNKLKIRKSKLYAKLLMEIKLGRILSKEETIDHIDGDPTNDSLENLQILSRHENCKKGPCSATRERIRELNRQRMNNPEVKEKMKKFTLGENNGKSKISNEKVKYFREQFAEGNISQKEIISLTGLDRKTVQNFLVGRTYLTAGGPLSILRKGHSKN